MDSRARLHAELIASLRQHCAVADERHLVQLGWMVTGLLFSPTVCFDRWKQALPLGHCLAASWQRRFGTVCSQPSCQEVAEAALVLASGTTTTSAEHRTHGAPMMVSPEMCPSVRV